MAQSFKEYSGLDGQTNPVLSYSDLQVLTGLTNITVILITNYGLETEVKTTLVLGTHYTLNTTNKEVTLISSALTLTSADRVAVLRTTDVTNPAVAFSDTALLTDTDLNKSVKQSVFKLQEVSEQSADGYDTTTLSLSGSVNANSSAITAIQGNDWVVNERIATGAVNSDSISNGSILGEDVNASSVAAVIGPLFYPVGSIYCNYSNSTNPSSLLGFGTWTRIEGKVVVGFHSGDSDFGTLGEDPSYGEKTHQLTVAELASHTHSVGVSSVSDMDDDENKPTAIMTGSTQTSATGGDQPHNNLQPYAVVNMWRRTA